MNQSANEFDEKAKAWDNNLDHARRAQIIADAICTEVPITPSFTAMEYGCGTGLLSFPLRHMFAKITLVDNSSGMIDVLREKIAHSGVTNMEFININLLDEPDSLSMKFSVIYSSMVLHHITDVKKAFSVWHSLLEEPGYLCIADLDSDGGLFHGPEFTGHNGFNRDELKEIVEGQGFTDVKFRNVCEITKESRDGKVHTFPLFLMACRKS